ncbi:unnamed protein product [Cylicocyclus nassatus]|uniref:Digestive organ expansion factor-like protein n=1 Tax=Cylicocyclus nassatus TaxID=53992 RepID=A0AA36GXZ9_CYLNA|nr:unnamed protein product [Cylicocyclus nassatus]
MLRFKGSEMRSLLSFLLFGSSTFECIFSNMVHELFFEIVREKQHVFCDAKDTAPVLELKRIVEGVLKIPVTDQVLVRLLDDSNTNFLPLDDKKTLAESGFTVNNAKAQTPAMVALMFRGESAPVIDELSTPPPVPDAMRNEAHSQDMKAKKRKLDSSGPSDEPETLIKTSLKADPEAHSVFTKRFEFTLDSDQCDKLKAPKSKRAQRQFDLPSLGPAVEYIGVMDEASIDKQPILPSETGWSESLIRNFESEEADKHRADFLNIVTRYIDLYAQPTPGCHSYRTVYLAHALNHVIRTRNSVIANNRKLEAAGAKGLVPDELVESCRDQGFVRPTVLILCPFKKDAFDIVQRLERLIFGRDSKGSIWSRERFNEEFKSEAPPEFKTRVPDEFRELMTGNNDDCFRVGIALSKKVLKLYEGFDKSDFILCSPLGLRMILDGEAGKESHLISNIQIAVIDKADIMLQQNWEHLSIIFSHIHTQPSRIDTDISRVRQCYIDGQAKFFCQLLLFSRYRHELFSALMSEHSLNFRGLIMQNNPCEGTLDKIEIPLCQEFRRFDVENPSEQAVARFNCFKDYCNASLLPGTCVVIPSYFDFVRVRNHFKRTEESFVACHEYAPKTKITRARDLFYHKIKKILVVTERYYFFNRRTLRGMERIVFYQLPNHPDLYCELINMASCESETRIHLALIWLILS